MNEQIMLVAGEASGDMHGARLVRALRQMAPDLRFTGMGGSHLRESGVRILVDSDRLAVMGLVEVVTHWGEIHQALRTLQAHIRSEPPALLILVDYVEFNLKLAKAAKVAGVKVLFYVSPQVWAWRSHRVKKIGERVDHMAVLFPFEVGFYERAGIPVTYVGHPLAKEVHPSMPRAKAIEAFGLDPAQRHVGLFPGSRPAELKRLLPVLLGTAALLRRRHPDLQFVLPVASTLPEAAIRAQVQEADVPITVIGPGRIYDVINVCDSIVTASGTATLEIALMETPMVILYKLAPLTFAIVRHLVHLDHIGLANIVAGEQVVQEFIQHRARPQLVAAEIERLLTDQSYAARVRKGLVRVKERIGSEDGSLNTARLALQMLGREPQHANPVAKA
jgi:lipid-A-disaccharide synthase